MTLKLIVRNDVKTKLFTLNLYFTIIITVLFSTLFSTLYIYIYINNKV